MALPQLSVDQMKALPETVAFPIERFCWESGPIYYQELLHRTI